MNTSHDNSEFEYADIIDRSRPVHHGDDFSVKHPPMSISDRAKIFAPFAALSGHSDAIKETGRQHTEAADRIETEVIDNP